MKPDRPALLAIERGNGSWVDAFLDAFSVRRAPLPRRRRIALHLPLPVVVDQHVSEEFDHQPEIDEPLLETDEVLEHHNPLVRGVVYRARASMPTMPRFVKAGTLETCAT